MFIFSATLRSLNGFLPRRLTEPESGKRMPEMILRRVVFPDPFGPSRLKISPGRTARETSFKAWKGRPFSLNTLETEEMGRGLDIVLVSGGRRKRCGCVEAVSGAAS